MSTTHIVGAGIAGLATAVRLVRGGRSVILYEAAGQAGGRCRSFFDESIGRTIDNGNHLLLGGNRAAMAYLDEIGNRAGLTGPDSPVFPFLDLATGDRWTVRPNAGPIPWWILSPRRRVPGSRASDYLAALRLRRAGRDDTVAACFDTSRAAFDRFWSPIAVAVLNAGTEEGAARLLWPLIQEIFARGGTACRPLIAREGLSQALVEPALSLLREAGSVVRFNMRLRAIEHADNRVTALHFGTGRIDIAATEQVVLAVPPAAAAELLPNISVPTESRAIVNAHYRLDRPPTLLDGMPFLGLLGGEAHWLFLRGDVVAVTVSAADALAETPSEEIAARLWVDVANAISLPAESRPIYRIIKEKRATFAQTPAALARRPKTRTAWRNFVLAGDWIDTGLPATIEGAARSGHMAASILAE